MSILIQAEAPGPEVLAPEGLLGAVLAWDDLRWVVRGRKHVKWVARAWGWLRRAVRACVVLVVSVGLGWVALPVGRDRGPRFSEPIDMDPTIRAWRAKT